MYTLSSISATRTCIRILDTGEGGEARGLRGLKDNMDLRYRGGGEEAGGLRGIKDNKVQGEETGGL